MHYYPDGTNDFAKYPIETLAEGAGDCEDKSILFASIAEALGYEALICIVPGHAFVAVHMATAPTHYAGANPWSITVGGLQYWICETTSYGWRVGDCPPAYQGMSPTTAPVP